MLLIGIKESWVPTIMVSMKRQLVMFSIFMPLGKVAEIVVGYEFVKGILISGFVLLVVC